MENQKEFINKNLKFDSTCFITKPEYISKISTLNPSIINKIITDNFTIGPDMKAILCLFNTLINSNISEPKNSALYFPTIKIQNWITKMTKLKTSGVEGFIYVTNILSDDIEIIIKIPQQVEFENELKREYFISLRAINNLRYIIPTFVYTLGAFMCDGNMPKKHTKKCETHTLPFVIYEKIDGSTVSDHLYNKISFDDWLLIFCQILLSLEIAQREYKFTHFDLHASNVMVRPTNSINYDIPLDHFTYSIKNIKKLPVIIDCGLATVEVDSHTVGSYTFPEYGMMPYMIQGYDMYKFLCYSVANCKAENTKSKMFELFKFYGNDDPYNIYKKKSIGLKAALEEYCGKCTYSKIASYTPLSFFQWIYNISEYKNILIPNIEIKNRSIYNSLKYSSTIQIYNNLFHNDNQHEINDLVYKCINKIPSYINSKYILKTLTNYNKTVQSSYIDQKIKDIEGSLTENYIENDKISLNKVFDTIVLPNMDDLKANGSNILNLKLSRNAQDKILGKYEKNKELIKKFIEDSKYTISLNPYWQMYYTILELDLEDTYREWIDKFKSTYYKPGSQQYIIDVLKWCYTLEKSNQYVT